MSSKKYKFVRKVRNIKKHGWLKLKITVATAAVLSGVFFCTLNCYVHRERNVGYFGPSAAARGIG